ncbi:TlpA family protein disulfide reductase [Desulfovibrio oxyclinae]|jgi:thiol-disulfide isomerase/thioredoxin|uniref:TlpA family protein disulfide reductase n=1 Tax=Desulfovibrio oxyclinae TaxID=63560 RepID=UPI0003608B90|nr:TlpA disulfide reductase family protein [Desulfovibrio oxyclinae]
MKTARFIHAPLMALIILLAGCLPSAAEYPVLDPSAMEAKLSESKGTPTLVVFWATWCPPCMKEIPELERYKREAGDSVDILAISVNDGPEQIDKFFGGETPLDVYRATEGLLRKRRISGIPRSDFYNASGEHLYSFEGYSPEVLHTLMRSLTHPDEFSAAEHDALRNRFPTK